MKRFWSEAAERVQLLRHLHSPSDARLFLQIFVFAAVVPALVLLKPSQLEALLAPKKVRPAADLLRVQKIASYVDAAQKVGSPLIRSGCLTRGLALYYFLNRSGLDVALCFGIGKIKGEFLGHCWLVKDGEPFLETKDPRPLYRQTYAFPHALTPFGDLRQPLNPLRQANE